MIIDRIGRNRFVQKVMKKAEDKKFYEKLNHNLPLIESAYTTLAYVGATEFNKKIPDERKKPLIWQSLIGGIAGIAVSKRLDTWVKGHAVKVCDELEKLNLPKGKNLVQGARILMPLVVSTFVMRYLVSVLSVPTSTWITNKQKKIKKFFNRG